MDKCDGLTSLTHNSQHAHKVNLWIPLGGFQPPYGEINPLAIHNHWFQHMCVNVKSGKITDNIPE